MDEDGSVGFRILWTAWVVWTTQIGLLMIEVAEPVPSQNNLPVQDVDAVLPAINPVIIDSRVLNPLLPLLDDSTKPLVRS